MNDSLFPYDDSTPDEPPDDGAKWEAKEAATIAAALLLRTGWTGVEINALERIAGGQNDNVGDALSYVENLRDARAREDALK